MNPGQRIGIAALLLLAFASAPAAAQKTDVVLMKNGDRFTGEIKRYEDGRLSLDSTDSGVVSIKWNRILSLTSDKTFDVKLIDDSHLYGSLAPSTPPGQILVVLESASVAVDFLGVVRMDPLYQTFWRRFSGSVDLGATYTQASQFVQFTLNATTTYRLRTAEINSALSAFYASQTGATPSERASFSLQYIHYLKNRWILGAVFGADRNQDLGLDLRLTAGGGAGRFVVQTNQTRLAVLVGFAGIRETPLAGASTYNVEAVVNGTYSTFMYDYPKVKINATLSVIPGLTDAGRVRVQFNASASREIISDFYIALSVFDSFDNRPPTAGAAKNDWGPVLSLGYKF